MAAIRRGEAGKAPPPPLRYRIDPTAKKLDDLDSLELELRRHELDYEPDDFEAMLDKLQRQRAGIIKARDKHLPPDLPPLTKGWDLCKPVPKRQGERWSISRIFYVGLILYVVWKIITNSS